MKKIIQIILLACGLVPFLVSAQTVIRGKVTDKQGALPGVSVQEKGVQGNGASTNVNGEFQLSLKGSSHILVFSALGYATQEINVTGKPAVTVSMSEDARGLNEVIVVGYGTTKKLTNTGAASSLAAKEIKAIPTPNIQNTLAGRVPGFISQQRSGQPGKSGADFYIRGVNSLASESQKPLVIVDDVEYAQDQVSQLDVNEIESVTILKDASTTAVYGIKGANGVLVITTRRGKLGKPKVNFNTESGLQSSVITPNFLGAYDVATLRNEALKNDGLAPEFTDADLEHWRTGDDPYGHADVDWYNAVFKKYAYQIRNNADISGGSEKVKYFISIGQVAQDGLLRNFSKGTGAPQNNYGYERYTFRSNLDMKATKDLDLRLDLTGRIGATTEPHIATAPLSTIYSFQRLPPYAAPLINPDGSYPWAKRSRNIYLETSLIGRLALQGYDKTYRNEFNILFSGTQKLNFITKGLAIRGRVAFAGDISYQRSLSRDNIPAFYYDPSNGSYTLHSNGLYRLEPLDLSSASSGNISRRTINTLANLDYNRTFGDHTVYGLLLYNLNRVNNATYNSATGITAVQEYAPVSSQGTTFRVGYNYKQRYLVEFDGAYNGTNQFVGNKTMGFFPAASVGWNIAEEPFFNKRVKFIELLKLRGSIGLVGSDITAGNTYKTEQVYVAGPNYNFGETSTSASSIQEGSLGNLNITWEKSRKLDVGLDMQTAGGLNLTVDYFYDRRYDQLARKEDVLRIIGVDLPFTNSAITENKGWDGQVSYSKQAGDFFYSGGFTFSFAKNKILYTGEATPRYPWLAKTGLPIGQGFGYNVLGFFQDQNEIDNYAHLANVKPGDLKYEDLNADGAIDQQDQRAIGKPNLPQTVLGSTVGFGYKGLSVNVLFQGSFDYSYRIAVAGVIPFQGNLQQSALGRWTPTNSVNATFPRLSSDLAGPSSPSNASSFWLINKAKYIRFKSIDLGYEFPKAMLSKVKISRARVYISGYDLYTWSNFRLYTQDPEIASNGSAGTYPAQKVYNLGLQVGF